MADIEFARQCRSARKPIAGALRLVSAEGGEREAEIDAADLRIITPMVRGLAPQRSPPSARFRTEPRRDAEIDLGSVPSLSRTKFLLEAVTSDSPPCSALQINLGFEMNARE
ncbi:hypothetical protein IY145_21675 [Methylosinus sp. H3A]|uniref:hypothetical protein n=1 Tax=Methylosinus sp. H3A TaxID=2785786 RepID=UPI0018C34720|nr:hypothetical protein [Methylosinus sp. H3A]MBG0811955.1 hypothetical protein [Methylosinus sp. H3A]